MALLILCVVAMSVLGGWLAMAANFQLWPRHMRMLEGVLLAAACAYVVLMALPFTPGIEIGLSLMAMLGRDGALLVYVATVAALSLSFAMGRVIPLCSLGRVLGWFSMHRARDLVCQLEPLEPDQRIDYLLHCVPSNTLPFLVKHRYLVIAAALNVPGNALIGGGGGIGLLTGMSGLVSFPRYLLVVAAAVAPVPIVFLLTGSA